MNIVNELSDEYPQVWGHKIENATKKKKRKMYNHFSSDKKFNKKKDRLFILFKGIQTVTYIVAGGQWRDQ